MDIRAKFFQPSLIPKKELNSRDATPASSMGRFSTSIGIGMGKRDIGATLERLVGGVQCGQQRQQQSCESLREALHGKKIGG